MEGVTRGGGGKVTDQNVDTYPDTSYYMSSFEHRHDPNEFNDLPPEWALRHTSGQ